jgi:hypothetical protein
MLVSANVKLAMAEGVDISKAARRLSISMKTNGEPGSAPPFSPLLQIDGQVCPIASAMLHNKAAVLHCTNDKTGSKKQNTWFISRNRRPVH